MIVDAYLQFKPDEEALNLAHRLGFDTVFYNKLKVLKKYTKSSLLSNIKSLKYDLILGLEKNPSYFTSGLAKIAGQKKVGVLFLFSTLLNSKPIERSKYLRNMRKVTRLCVKYDVPIVLSSGARDMWELRGKSELLALGSIIGLNGKQAKNAISIWPMKYIYKEEIVKVLE